jgi:hypothetical protein
MTSEALLFIIYSFSVFVWTDIGWVEYDNDGDML